MGIFMRCTTTARSLAVVAFSSHLTTTLLHSLGAAYVKRIF